MSKLPKHRKQWLSKSLGYVKYDFQRTLWLYLTRWRRFSAFFQRHFDLIRGGTIIVSAAAVGVLINYFGGGNFRSDILSGFLVAAGAMTGATIAIVFTISILLLQNASDIYSSQYLEVYIHDWREKSIYFVVILIAIALFGGGLFVGSLSTIPPLVASLLVLSSLILIGTVFALIDWQYKIVRQKITPPTAIAFLEKEATRFLKRLKRDAAQMARIMRAGDESVSHEVAIAAAYNQFLQPFISNLDRQLENLVEISVKLADRHEIGTTKRSFTAVYSILARFLEVRKTSSLVMPSGISILAAESDSQAFLTRSCERLNTVAEGFIRERKDELAVHIVEVYGALAVKAKDIVFIGRENNNPILDLFTAYLNFVIEHAQRAQNTEVVYQGSRVLGEIAAVAADKGLDSTLVGVQEKLLTSAVFGLTQKNVGIVDRCTMTFLHIVGAVFRSTTITRQHHVAAAFKNLTTITNYHAKLIGSGLVAHDFSTSISFTKPYDELPPLLVGIADGYAALTDQDAKARYRYDLVELFEELNTSLRKLAEEVKSCDTILSGSIGHLLFDASNLIIALHEDPEFADERDELRRRLPWNVHLPGWFAHHAAAFDGGSIPFSTLIDSVAKTGIVAAERLGDRELVNDCINSLCLLTERCLEKTTSTYGFDEPRVLKKACYLGIIGLKKGWREVVTNIGLKIYEHEPKYYAKYFTKIPEGINPANHNVMGLPHRDQLMRELWRWRDDWSGRGAMRDDAEAMLHGVIEPIDIDRFIFEVWGVWLTNTRFDTEMKLKSARTKLLRVLEDALKRKRDQEELMDPETAPES